MKRIIATEPPELAHKKSYIVALGYAGVAVLVTLGLLFKFDELLEYVTARTAFGGAIGVIVLAMTVIAGVFALPYLLRMAVSPLMRTVSILCAILLPGWWLLAGWWIAAHVGGLTGFACLIGGHVALLWMLASLRAIGVPVPRKKH